MREPRFWWDGPGIVSAVLSPFGALYGSAAASRMRREGQRAAKPFHNLVSALRGMAACRLVLKPCMRALRQHMRIVHLHGAMTGIEHLVDVGEVADMRPVQQSGAELGRFDRILPAMFHQRPADEHDRSDRIEQAEFADRVEDIDVGVFVRELALRAQHGAQPPGTRDFGDAGAALWMPWRNERQ